MHFLRTKWKLCLMVCLALMMLASFSFGCTIKPTIKLGDNQFESIWIINAITEFIIEEGYGYPVETVTASTALAQVALDSGDIDIWMEMWQQNWQDNYDELIAENKIENLGMVYEGGPQLYIIPAWVAEEYDIETIFDMKDHWELFEDPADPSKGYFINCIIGWQCEAINNVKLEAYGLTDYYNIVAPGSPGAMEAALAGAQMKEDPIFGYYWSPTALMGMYDWYVLEEPEYNDDIWADIIVAKDDPSLRPLDTACAYEVLPVDKGINIELRNTAPDIVAMLEKMMVGLERLNATAAWATTNEVQDYKEAAVYFLQTYEATWQTWVTTDAYNKIKQALAEY